MSTIYDCVPRSDPARCRTCLHDGSGSHGTCREHSDRYVLRDGRQVLECRHYELDPEKMARPPRVEPCALCRAPSVLHLPPWAGSEALCRVCADRLRAELTPPDEAERRALAAIGDRASRVPAAELALEGRPSGDGMRWELAPRAPRCPCPECSRG